VIGQDGGGGGGGGGAVVLDVKNFPSLIQVLAKGGDGATTIFQGGFVGPGGGGGGGVVWVPQSQAPSNLNAITAKGRHGVHKWDNNKDGWKSTDGTSGLVLTDLIVPVAKGTASVKSSSVFTLGQPSVSIKTAETADVELDLSFPATSAMIGFIPDTVILTVGFDTKTLELSSVEPSSGWVVKRVIGKNNGAEIVFYNSTHIAIPASMDFGKIVFTALNAPVNASALVYLADMRAITDCNIITASPDIETAFLRRIIVNSSGVPKGHVPTVSAIKLYPNPATNTVRVSYEGFTQSPTTISVVDVAGKTILAKRVELQSSNDYSISLVNLISGSYTVVINGIAAQLDIVK
jgi:hypothetical protein